jgi:hypothetical protein
MSFSTDSVVPSSTITVRGLSTWVQAPPAPLRPLASVIVIVKVVVTVVLIQSLDLVVISSSFEGLSVIWLLNI